MAAYAREWNAHRNMQKSNEHHYHHSQGRMQQAAPWEARERAHCQPSHVGPLCAPAGPTPPQINTAIIEAANTGKIRMLIQVIHHHLPNMNMVNLSTALYRCGKFAADNSHTRNMLASDPVVGRLVEVVLSSVKCMRPATAPCQAISNIAWALASMQRPEQELMGLIAHLSLAGIDRFKFFELSSLLWAFAKLDARSFLPDQTWALFDVSAAQLSGNVHGLQLRTLSTISWAFATAKQIHVGLFRSLAQEIQRQARHAKPQEISNIVWAFGTAGQKDVGLLEALGDAGVRQVHLFKSQEISNTLWGMAVNSYYHPKLFQAALVMTANREMNSQHLANILWACARARPRHATTRSAIVMLAPRCVSIMHTFKPQEGASTLLAVAKAFGSTSRERGPPTLPSQVLDFCYVAEQWVIPRTCSFSVQSFGNVISAFACLGPESHSQQLWSAVESELGVRARRTSASGLVVLLRSLLAGPVPARTISPVASALCQRLPSSRNHTGDLLRLYTSQGGEVGAQGVEMALLTWLQSLARAEETPLIQKVPESYFHEESQAWAQEGSAGADVQTSWTTGRADEGDIWTSAGMQVHESERSTDDPDACESCDLPVVGRDRLGSWRNIVTFEELPDLQEVYYSEAARQESQALAREGSAGADVQTSWTTGRADEGGWTSAGTTSSGMQVHESERSTDDPDACKSYDRPLARRKLDRQPSWRNIVTFEDLPDLQEVYYSEASQQEPVLGVKKSELGDANNKAEYTVKNTFVEVSDESSEEEEDDLGMTTASRRRATTFFSVHPPGLNDPSVAGSAGAEEPTTRRSSSKKRTPLALKLIPVPNRADYSVKNTFVEISGEGSAEDQDELLTAEFRRRAMTFRSDSAVKNSSVDPAADDSAGVVQGTGSAPLKGLRARLRTTMMKRSADAEVDATARALADASSEGTFGSVDPSPRATAQQ